MFKNALDFSKLKVRDCMTPRTDLEIIDITETPEVLYNKFVETGLSKILVYGGTPDNIIGYVHQKEVFKKVDSIKEIVFPIEIVPATTSVMDVLNRFSKTRSSIALVVNELAPVPPRATANVPEVICAAEIPISVELA